MHSTAAQRIALTSSSHLTSDRSAKTISEKAPPAGTILRSHGGADWEATQT
jgi:hypothetical protein